ASSAHRARWRGAAVFWVGAGLGRAPIRLGRFCAGRKQRVLRAFSPCGCSRPRKLTGVKQGDCILGITRSIYILGVTVEGAMTNLTLPIFTDPEAARAHLEGLLWPSGTPSCLHCGIVGETPSSKAS